MRVFRGRKGSRDRAYLAGIDPLFGLAVPVLRNQEIELVLFSIRFKEVSSTCFAIPRSCEGQLEEGKRIDLANTHA